MVSGFPKMAPGLIHYKAKSLKLTFGLPVTKFWLTDWLLILVFRSFSSLLHDLLHIFTNFMPNFMFAYLSFL